MHIHILYKQKQNKRYELSPSPNPKSIHLTILNLIQLF